MTISPRTVVSVFIIFLFNTLLLFYQQVILQQNQNLMHETLILAQKGISENYSAVLEVQKRVDSSRELLNFGHESFISLGAKLDDVQRRVEAIEKKQSPEGLKNRIQEINK